MSKEFMMIYQVTYLDLSSINKYPFQCTSMKIWLDYQFSINIHQPY